MRHRLAMLTITALVGALISWPLAQTVGAQSQTPGLTLPAVTGTLARGGQFSGTLTITRLTNRAGQLVADGLVAGNVTTESVWATPVSTGVPATGTPIFSATSTPTPTFETAGAIATPVTPATTSTPVPTSTISAATQVTPTTSAVTATPTVGPQMATTTTPTGEDQLQRTPLIGDAAQQQSTAINQIFREIPMTLTDPDMGACDTLSLDLGVVFVDQLGVQLDLAPATIDLSAMPKANRPLGGLLCTVASLLDLGPSSTQATTLNEVLPIINRALTTAVR